MVENRGVVVIWWKFQTATHTSTWSEPDVRGTNTLWANVFCPLDQWFSTSVPGTPERSYGTFPSVGLKSQTFVFPTLRNKEQTNQAWPLWTYPDLGPWGFFNPGWYSSPKITAVLTPKKRLEWDRVLMKKSHQRAFSGFQENQGNTNKEKTYWSSRAKRSHICCTVR